MPLKTCTNCGKEHGPRKKKCDCGYVFIGGKNPLYPEPGTWVLDPVKGLPKSMPPEPVPRDHKMTNREIQDYVLYEGLGFCVYSLISSDRIRDKRLAKLWSQSRAAMQKVVEYLEEAP
jgi:hypothetical protein